MDGGFEGREDGEGKRSWGRECLWNFSHAGLRGRLDWDVLLSSVFFGFRVLGLAGVVITQLERRVTGIYCLVCVLF